ncbi:MAG: tetraprenyl-beta-curcumene synthase family protein [Bacillota bacterium]
MHWLHQPRVIATILRQVLPEAARELARWELGALTCPEVRLRQQALASLERKRFHAQGASVYGALAGPHRHDLVSITVALQTISDYLDNLCDRADVCDEHAFRRLHLAMTAALGPPGRCYDGFYDAYPYRDDGGYLRGLVAECQYHAARLPSLEVVRSRAVRLLDLYSDLQVLKHLRPRERVGRLVAWHARRGRRYPGVAWHEFAAATGSTLGVFALLAAAARPGLDEAEAASIERTYFPVVCGLHILLDYLIDQEEDARHGDLNFCTFYTGPGQCQERLSWFVGEALKKVAGLPQREFHLTVIHGLLAVYLSDPKAGGETSSVGRALLATAGPHAKTLHALCRALRRWRVLQRD